MARRGLNPSHPVWQAAINDIDEADAAFVVGAPPQGGNFGQYMKEAGLGQAPPRGPMGSAILYQNLAFNRAIQAKEQAEEEEHASRANAVMPGHMAPGWDTDFDPQGGIPRNTQWKVIGRQRRPYAPPFWNPILYSKEVIEAKNKKWLAHQWFLHWENWRKRA